MPRPLRDPHEDELLELTARVVSIATASAGPEGRHWRLLRALELWHQERGTRNGRVVAFRQALLAFLVAEGWSIEAVADELGVSIRTARGYRKAVDVVVRRRREASFPPGPDSQ